MHRKTYSRVLSFLMVLAMVLSLLPMTALASGDTVDVYVSVENTTFTSPESGDTPAWTGVLLEPYRVTIPAGTTIMEATVIAFEENGITENGSGGNYIDDINGLKAFDGTYYR